MNNIKSGTNNTNGDKTPAAQSRREGFESVALQILRTPGETIECPTLIITFDEGSIDLKDSEISIEDQTAGIFPPGTIEGHYLKMRNNATLGITPKSPSSTLRFWYTHQNVNKVKIFLYRGDDLTRIDFWPTGDVGEHSLDIAGVNHIQVVLTDYLTPAFLGLDNLIFSD
ncbi:hypothetical protein [Pseudomonas sp.]|uniref:hypothetical protein n=1 Tax=Pseudomonas sp. TaxID=306 RepID=UPI00262AD79E|nr:hypothetical protein [Pseudomonas sp.]